MGGVGEERKVYMAIVEGEKDPTTDSDYICLLSQQHHVWLCGSC